MMVRVRLFAAARQLAGADAVEVEVAEPPTIAGLRNSLAEEFPSLADLVRHAFFAVNTEYAASHASISPHDEVACIPPVSGG